MTKTVCAVCQLELLAGPMEIYSLICWSKLTHFPKFLSEEPKLTFQWHNITGIGLLPSRRNFRATSLCTECPKLWNFICSIFGYFLIKIQLILVLLNSFLED